MPAEARARAVVNVGNTRTRFVRHEAGAWVEDLDVPSAALLAALRPAAPARPSPRPSASAGPPAPEYPESATAPIQLPNWPLEWPVALVSVVPSLSAALAATWGAERPGLKRIVSGERANLRLDYEPPNSLGADRFCNAVALRAGPGWGLAIDCGTATTLTVVTPDGVLVGGAIMPGVGTAFKSLASGTAQLPEAAAQVPAAPWGRTTQESIQLGVIMGQAGAIAHLAARMREALPPGCPVVLTGGWSTLLAPYLPGDFRPEPNWTLEGARAAYPGA